MFKTEMERIYKTIERREYMKAKKQPHAHQYTGVLMFLFANKDRFSCEQS